ncbi:MAG: hypothetical protein AAF591_12230 [Verrucomicrobiota bacterium]
MLGVGIVGVGSAWADTFDLNGNHPGPGISEVMGFGGVNDGSKGVPVAGGFDCDGDGHRDTAFSLIQASPFGRVGAGLAMLVFGDGTIDGPSINSEPAQAGVLKVAGADTFEVCGAEVWMDDLTGDGLGDFIIGRQNYDSVSGNSKAGALTILIGGTALKAHAATLTTFDLAAPAPGVKVVTFEGKAAGNRLGIWMRTGDVTGDGIADLVVGEDQASDQGFQSGAVWVIRGGPHLATAPATVDLADFGTTALEGHLARLLPPPNTPGYHLGATCQVGDLDGNGRAEVLAAAALNRAGAGIGGDPTGGPFRGALFISWDENFPPWLWPPGYEFEIMDPPIGDFTRINGGIVGPYGDLTGRHDKFGEEILAGKDYSGDGCPDLFVGDITGSVYDDGNLSLSAAGLGHVFWNAANLRGREFGMSAVPNDIKYCSIFGPNAGALSSDTVAHGDYDDDGIDDAIVGNPHGNPPGRSEAGTVHVLYGQPGGWPEFINLDDGLALPSHDDLRLLLIYGAESNDVLCYSAATGDIDQDGKDDFIVNEMKGDNTLANPDQNGVGNLLVIGGGTMLPAAVFGLTYAPTGVVEYGAVEVGGGSAVTETVTITNTSGGTVMIQSLGLDGPQTGPYSVSSDTGETSLGPGGTRTVMIDFLPTATGWFGAALVVTTDVDEYRSGVGLKGAGIEVGGEFELTMFSADDAGEVRLMFESRVGHEYDVLRDDVLPPVGVEDAGVMGTGAPIPVMDLVPLSTRNAFYQVREAPAGGP